MNILIMHNSSCAGSSGSFWPLVASPGPAAWVVSNGLVETQRAYAYKSDVLVAVPKHSDISVNIPAISTIHYDQVIELPGRSAIAADKSPWLVLSNARFIAKVADDYLRKALEAIDGDVTCVQIDPELLAFREKVQLTSDGNIAGLRRNYADVSWPCTVPNDWPAMVFIKANRLDKLSPKHRLPIDFGQFLNQCRNASLRVCGFRIAGSFLDLHDDSDLLSFFQETLSGRAYHNCNNHNDTTTVAQLLPEKGDKNRLVVHSDIQIQEPGANQGSFFGDVVLGQNVELGKNVMIVGTTIIGDNVKIGDNAVLRSCVLANNVTVPIDAHFEHHIVLGNTDSSPTDTTTKPKPLRHYYHMKLSFTNKRSFRKWPWFSYGSLVKRLLDILSAVVVIVLFAPVLPVIAIVIKLSSQGPIFFKHKRQGLNGKEFNCVKFRTMMVGADKIQDRLRVKNQVDGPQFKMEDDPRVSNVGEFLRETCIDEIPQFFNVFLGQMSLVGPRPSPESENTFCAYWRDARLSVRPGITGLWQVCRTRDAGQDFQEWVNYDTKYVRKLSFRLDCWICWRTIKQLVAKFLTQF